MMLRAGLYLVATPIGNLGDMTFRAVDTLKGVARIYCEDTRVSRKLCEAYDIRTPLASYHEHNAERVRPAILAALAEGQALALISDAGMPLISDPGFDLVRAVRAAGHYLTSIPGASAVPMALQLSGLPSDRFTFAGFAPSRSAGRQRWFAELLDLPSTLIFFDSAQRIDATLADLAALGAGERSIAITRELTKKFEEVRTGQVRDFLAAPLAVKGELTLVLAPPQQTAAAIDGPEVTQALAEALTRLPTKAAAAEVAQRFGLSRRAVYQQALAAPALAQPTVEHER